MRQVVEVSNPDEIICLIVFGSQFPIPNSQLPNPKSQIPNSKIQNSKFKLSLPNEPPKVQPTAGRGNLATNGVLSSNRFLTNLAAKSQKLKASDQWSTLSSTLCRSVWQL